MPKPREHSTGTELLRSALETALGAALLLDSKLQIRLATRSAETLLGATAEIGASATKVLCGNSPKRPIAQALAQGQAVTATIPHPDSSAGHMLQVRALPLAPDGRCTGWLLLLDTSAAEGGEAILFQGMWAQSARMKEVFEIIRRVAPEDVTVLIRGETGAGKELVAQALHALSRRCRGPFRAINCAALPPNLLESELFGHVRGAFTGAVRDTPGHFQLATRGTLFLDEVGELPLELQAKLLRVLESRTILPVGGREAIPIDVRVVSATHRPLRKEVEQGRFRADLMYRLRVIPIFLPALRERRDDIGLLAHKLIEGMNLHARRRIEGIAAPALTVLERHDWPGNVRELHNVLSYAYIMGRGPLLQLGDLPPELLHGAGEALAARPEPLDEQARRIVDTLERTGGNRSKAADVLGMSRVTLWRRMRELGLERKLRVRRKNS